MKRAFIGLALGANVATAANVEPATDPASQDEVIPPLTEWAKEDPGDLQWSSRYGGSVMPRGDDAAFYTSKPRLGMWTSLEYRTPPEEGWYSGIGAQVSYEFSNRMPFGDDLQAELIVWDLVARIHPGFHWNFGPTGLSAYGVMGAGAQLVRGRVWSSVEPLVESKAAGLVSVFGAGGAFTFLANRIELVVELGYRHAPPVEIQQDGPDALELPAVSLSAPYLQAGVGLAF